MACFNKPLIEADLLICGQEPVQQFHVLPDARQEVEFQYFDWSSLVSDPIPPSPCHSDGSTSSLPSSAASVAWMQNTPVELRSDPTVMLAAVQQDGEVVKFVDPVLFSDASFMLALVSINGSFLEIASEAVRKDVEVVSAAVSRCGTALRFADERLAADAAIALAACKQDPDAMAFVSSALYDDRAFMVEAVKIDGGVLQYAPPDLKADPEVAMNAVRNEAWVFELLPDDLRANVDIAFEAIRRDGWTLEHALGEARGNRDIVLAAVRQTGWAIMFASGELRTDREITLAAVRQCGNSLREAHVTLQADEEVVLEAVRQEGMALQYASEELKDNLDVVLAAVQENGFALEYASPGLRANREVLLNALHFMSHGRDEDIQALVGRENSSCSSDIMVSTATTAYTDRSSEGSPRPQNACRLPGQSILPILNMAAESLQESPDVLFTVLRHIDSCSRSNKLTPLVDHRGQTWTPEKARLNPFALQGLPGVVCKIEHLCVVLDHIEYSASVGLGGRIASGTLPLEARLQDLGLALQGVLPEVSDAYIHLLLLDDSTVDWQDATVHLLDVLSPPTTSL